MSLPSEPPELHLARLRTDIGLSEGVGLFYAEAASVVLEECSHQRGVSLRVRGSVEAGFLVFWDDVTDIIRNSHADLQDATEHGAYGIALLVIHDTTAYKAIEQSFKGTGFDWWLGTKNDDLPMQNMARLEVSGILNGTDSQVTTRVNQKLEQTKQSDDMMLPAVAVVVEYSRPIVQVAFR